MKRTFIQTQEFTRNWERLGLSDEDLRRLELEIMENPKSAPVIKGTGIYNRTGWFDTGTVLYDIHEVHICVPSQDLINKYK